MSKHDTKNPIKNALKRWKTKSYNGMKKISSLGYKIRTTITRKKTKPNVELAKENIKTFKNDKKKELKNQRTNQVTETLESASSSSSLKQMNNDDNLIDNDHYTTTTSTTTTSTTAVANRIDETNIWRKTIIFLSQQAYLTICLKLLTPLQCDYQKITQLDDDQWNDEDGKNVRYSTLRDQPSVECWSWEGPHPIMVLVGVSGLSFYILTAQVLSSDAGVIQSRQPSDTLDIVYPHLYYFGVQLVKFIVTVLSVILVNQPLYFEVLTALVFLIFAIITLRFKYISGFEACSIPSIVRLRATSYLFISWSAISSIYWLLIGSGKPTSLILISFMKPRSIDVFTVFGWAIIIILWISSFIYISYLNRLKEKKKSFLYKMKEDNFKKEYNKIIAQASVELLACESKLYKQHLLLNCDYLDTYQNNDCFWSPSVRSAWRTELSKVACGKKTIRLNSIARWLRELESLTHAAAFIQVSPSKSYMNNDNDNNDENENAEEGDNTENDFINLKMKMTCGPSFLRNRFAWIQALSSPTELISGGGKEYSMDIISQCLNAYTIPILKETKNSFQLQQKINKSLENITLIQQKRSLSFYSIFNLCQKERYPLCMIISNLISKIACCNNSIYISYLLNIIYSLGSYFNSSSSDNEANKANNKHMNSSNGEIQMNEIKNKNNLLHQENLNDKTNSYWLKISNIQRILNKNEQMVKPNLIMLPGRNVFTSEYFHVITQWISGTATTTTTTPITTNTTPISKKNMNDQFYHQDHLSSSILRNGNTDQMVEYQSSSSELQHLSEIFQN